MKILGCIEPEIDHDRRTPKAEIELGPDIARIEIDVDQELRGVVAEEFDIDLLPGKIAVKKESRD